ncbi:MAG: MFS transporter, partial [Chloroflexota bacterium]
MNPSPSSIWRDRDFVRLWSAGTISIFGSLIGRTAMPFVAILVLHAGALEVSVLLSLELTASLIVGLAAGAWVDRLRRRPVMIASDLGRAVLLATIPIAAIAGVLGLAQLYVVAFLGAILSTFFDLADRAYLPTLVAPERLVAANSALTASSSAAEFTGFGIGGLLVELLTAPFAVALDAVSFVVSALFVRSIRRPEPPPPPAADREPMLREIRHGLRLVGRSPVLRALALSNAFSHMTWGIFGAVYFLYASQELGLGPAAIGLIAGIGGLSSLAGALLVQPVVRRIGIGRTMLVGIVGFGVGNALIPLAPSGAVAIGALFLIGQQVIADGGATAYDIIDTSVRQSIVGDRLLGRVNATIRTSSTLLQLGATVFAGVVGEVYGLRFVLWVGLAGAFLAFASIWFSPLRSMGDVPD